MKKIIILIILLVSISLGVIVAFKTVEDEDSPVKSIFEKKDEYEKYKVGEVVNFADERWYVMYDSDKDKDYVTLISSDIMYLDDDELSVVFDGIYETSAVNDYLENEYINELGADNFIEINGYKARLFNQDDFESLIVAEYDDENDEYIIDNCPEFICLTNSFYATMIDTNMDVEFVDVYNNLDDIENILYDDYILHLKYYNISSTYEEYKLESLVDDATLFIRPVINIYKDSINKD